MSIMEVMSSPTHPSFLSLFLLPLSPSFSLCPNEFSSDVRKTTLAYYLMLGISNAVSETARFLWVWYTEIHLYGVGRGLLEGLLGKSRPSSGNQKLGST